MASQRKAVAIPEWPRQSLQREPGRAEKALADSGRSFNSSLWDARIPARARNSDAFERCIIEGYSGSVAARRREHHVAVLSSCGWLRAARRSGESRSDFVSRCGQV